MWCVSLPSIALVPAAVFQEKQKAELLAFTFSSPEGRCLSNELKDEPAELVFGVDEDVYEVLFPFACQSSFCPSCRSVAFAVEEAEPCALAPPAICRVASAEDGCGVLCAGKPAFCELVRV